MEETIKELISEMNVFQNDEMPDNLFDKLEGDIVAGAQVQIYWKDREDQDFGYVFVLPGQAADESDAFVHVPSPDNSEGIGDAPEVHIHISNLLRNDLVEKIVVTGGFN